STLPILRSFVSSAHSDVFRCHSVLDGPYLAPPYACSYSHGEPDARSGGTPLLAVATEQGTIHIMNTKQRNDWDPEPVRTSMQPHNNGIFAVKWNADDSLLFTGSGDTTARICDVQTSTPLQFLRGHSSTIKSMSCDPRNPNLLATGGREGMICIWDIRAGFLPVQTILAAHEDIGPSGKRNRSKGKRASPRTVTGLCYSDTNPFHLITSGSAEGILRCWDVRMMNPKRSGKLKEPPCILSSPADPTVQSVESSRPRGIISLVQGSGPSVGLVFALGMDARIHTYDRDSLTAFGHSYTHANLRANVYVGLAASPCGRWLASGGAGVSGSSFMFDVSNATRVRAAEMGVELEGVGYGEAGNVDFGDGMLATCWDDGIVRVWRSNAEGGSLGSVVVARKFL
ncbi:WD40-repeat-containing domain protein, partial [Mycena amicta]